MAKKKSPASLERKKLREKRERASALSKQSSVKADKKQAWWCQKKKGLTYNSLPSSQPERPKREEQEQTTQKQKNSFLASLLGCALSLYLFAFVYSHWLHRWYLVGPDTLYLRYGFSSTIVAFLVCMLEIGVLDILFNGLFFGVRDWFQSKIAFRSFLSQLKWWLLLFVTALALFFGPVLLSCLSRTEADSAGVSTYVLGIRTSRHSYEELEEAEFYLETFSRNRLRRTTYTTRNYALHFQDGYEINLTDLEQYCVGPDQYNQLCAIVSPVLEKH